MNSLLTQTRLLFLFIPLFFSSACKSDEDVNTVYPEGGYSYLKDVASSDTNFYFLPIRNTIERRDSINVVMEKVIYTAFDEPNLSIVPPSEDLFRFYYAGWPGETAIITLAKDRIIFKVPMTGSPYKAPDEYVLDSIEEMHYDLFDVQYRLSDPKFPEWRRRYIDSLLKAYPQLFDPAYHLKLINKKFSVVQSFEYTKKEIKISASKFNKIVSLINNSEYWKSPFNKADCSDHDGENIYLEAITKQKYQCIFHELCSDDTSKLRKAYNEVLKYAGVEDGKLGRQDLVSRWSTTEKVEVRELKLTEGKPESRSKKKKAQ